MEISLGQLELALMRAALDVFELRFYRGIGPLYVALDESRAQSARLRARFVPSAHRESLAAREEARVSAADCARALSRPAADPAAVKRLHHELARRFHPDLALDPVRRGVCEMLMTEVNLAERDGDLRRLESMRDAVSGDTDAAGEMAALSRSPLAQLRTRVAYGLRHRQDPLRELADNLRALAQTGSGASARSSNLVERSLADMQSAATRFLMFPRDRAMGEIAVRKELEIDAPVTVIGHARGIVQVPFGRSVILRVAKDCASLDRLRALDPDDLNGFIDEWPDFVSFDNAAVGPLSHFRRLEVLHLARTEIDGRVFDCFPPLNELRVLILDETQFDDHGMERLAESAWMQRLDLSFTRVTGKGLATLYRMASLRDLSLYGTNIGDADLEVLDSLPAIRNLNLGLTGITDVTAARLSHMKALEVLHLGGTVVTDSAVRALAGLPLLRDVVLWETKITDAALEALRSFPALRYLDADNTGATKAAMDGFRAARPDVRLPSDTWAESASA